MVVGRDVVRVRIRVIVHMVRIRVSGRINVHVVKILCLCIQGFLRKNCSGGSSSAVVAVKRVVVMATKNYCGDSNHVKNQDGSVVLKDFQI